MGYSKQSDISKPQCPFGHGNMEKVKTWEAKKTSFELWKCSRCGETVRITNK